MVLDFMTRIRCRTYNREQQHTITCQISFFFNFFHPPSSSSSSSTINNLQIWLFKGSNIWKNKTNRCNTIHCGRTLWKNTPLEVQNQVVFPETGHWVHVEALRDIREAYSLFPQATGANSYSPCYWEQHEEYSQDQNTHNTHAVASCHQPLLQVQLLSALHKMH